MQRQNPEVLKILSLSTEHGMRALNCDTYILQRTVLAVSAPWTQHSVTRSLQFQATSPKLKYFRCESFRGHLARSEEKPQAVAAAGKAGSCRSFVPDPCLNFTLGDCRHCSQQHWKRETWQNMFADDYTSEDPDWRCSDCA